LDYSSYLGGSGTDTANAVGVDSTGSAYIVGYTLSANFPSTFGSYAGAQDAFVTKINPAGNAIVYSAYLGGHPSAGPGRNGNDVTTGVAVDANGDAYVIGFTRSDDFPITAGAFQTTRVNGGGVNFVTKLNAAGNSLVYSTYLGGTTRGQYF